MNRDSAPLGADPRQTEGALRAQLGEISAASQLLLARAREEDRAYLATINRAAFRCSRLLYQGELARRLDGGGELAADLAPLDLVRWCREGCDRACALLKAADVAVDFACAEQELLSGADRELLDELLYALLSNAAKAVGPGGRVTVTLSRRGGGAVLSVGDRGRGMDEDALDRLASGELPPPDLTPGTGGGLGLRLCRAIAEAHGGRFVIETGPDAGTRAAASIPIREGEGGVFRSPRPEEDPDRALEALSEVLPIECFM